MKWKLLSLVGGGLLLVATEASAQTRVADAVMLVDVADVSGSMVKAVAAMTAAEAAQLERTLRPGDLYARVAFNAEARVSVLQEMRTPDDLGVVSTAVSAKQVAKGKTSISKGLMLAKEVAERHAGGRRVVLVLASDGENDPADGKAQEGQRLDAMAEWWRSRPATDRIVVGISRNNNRQQLEALAALLQARLVSLDDYKSNPLIERAIAEARAAAVPAPEPPPMPPPPTPASMSTWSWLLIALPLVAIGWVALRKTKGNSRPASPGAPIAVRGVEATVNELLASVTANGQTQQTVLPVAELEFGTATLGTAGTVMVPGLPGAPVTVLIVGDGLSVTEEMGTGVRVDGQPLGLMPQPARFGRECRLTHRGVAVTLQLRRGGERRGSPPIRVVAHGRRR